MNVLHLNLGGRFDAFLGRIFGTTRVEKAERAWKNSLWLVIVLGAVPLVWYAQSQPAPWTVLAGGFFVAGASAVVGALGGMIFGLPRPGTPTPGAKPSSDAATAPKAANQPGITPNTNMIEISDWLTKIIVGLGLTQLAALPGDFQRLVDWARGALGNASGSDTIVGLLILIYAVTGFILTYLFTRTDLEAAIAAADASPGAQLDLLSQLSELHRKQALTDDEFRQLKTKNSRERQCVDLIASDPARTASNTGRDESKCASCVSAPHRAC